MRWIGEYTGLVRDEPSEAERHGRRASFPNAPLADLQSRASFLANLHRPVGNLQQEDLQQLEDFLHGYYLNVIEEQQKQNAILKQKAAEHEKFAEERQRALESYERIIKSLQRISGISE